MSSTPDLTDTIQAIWVNRGNPTEWLPLRALRERLDAMEDVTVTRDQIDTALVGLLVTRTIRIIPESNQKTLTDADRDAALWLGGQHRHLITFTE